LNGPKWYLSKTLFYSRLIAVKGRPCYAKNCSNNSNGRIIDGKREYLTEMTVDYNYFEFNKIPIIKTSTIPLVSIIIALPIARWIATNWLRGFA
jgi:hypothetical protein